MSRRQLKDTDAPRPRAWLYAATLAAPVVLLLAIELVLRLAWKAPDKPLFVTAPVERPGYLMANRDISRRWFFAEQSPPAPIDDPFAAVKPARALRIFVLGESTTAGFPYPHNGTFSRMLRDALRDVLPSDSIEVVNLGIPATNSFAMVDMANEIIAQHPDAVLIYAGHNEYYGALGAASTEGTFTASSGLTRAYLSLQRVRLVYAMRSFVTWLRARRATPGAQQAPSFMETLANDQQIDLNGVVYKRGTRQFEENLDRLLGKFASAHVPAFIGSVASNVRDQAPLASPANGKPGGADSVFAQAQAALARRDTAGAKTLFVQARDLDVVRFRAPSEFNEIIRRAAKASGATYVPVAERFDSAAADGIPGHDLFLEHVHPNEHGIAVLASAFFDALRGASFLGHAAQLANLRSWDAYVAGMDLTPFDQRDVYHTLQTLGRRWPFVPASQATDYRATYHPTGVVDSAAFLVSRGAAWAPVKVGVARWYQQSGQPDSAIAELRGLARDGPLFAEPWELLAQAAAAAGSDALADSAYRHALVVRPSARSAMGLAQLAMKRKDPAAAIPFLQSAVQLEPMRADALYQLSLALALTKRFDDARLVARRLVQVAPAYPGLGDWLRTLGLVR